MRLGAQIAPFAFLFVLATRSLHAAPGYTVEEAVALALKQNPDIAIARKQVEAARGGVVEARSGFLPSVVSTGLLRKRARQEESRLRDNDYNASLRVVQNLYTGGAVTSQLAIARLIEEKRICEYEAVAARVGMDVRVAFYDVLLDRAKIRVREQSLGVLKDELKTQQERLSAGTVGELNVRRAQVALANEEPELIDAQTRLQNAYLRLGELLGVESHGQTITPPFEVAGQLQYNRRHPDLNESLARAELNRPEVKARQKDVEIEEQQLLLDKSEMHPHVEAFSGYEVYSERDPEIGREFNHGYVAGLNASWHIFDGFATRGRVRATRARRDAAILALQAARASASSDVRSAFLDMEQANRSLEAETRNVQNADESLEMAKGNLAAGLGTQLDVLQAATDVTRTRTTRLSAIYLYNVALTKLARATGRESETYGFESQVLKTDAKNGRQKQIFNLAKPPASLGANK
ncbi:MAG: TolC family protein [Chthoniobacterales bacterium]